MKPGRHCAQEPDGLFKTPLERFINMNDPLVQLAHRIDWDGLEAKITSRFSEEGRPAVPARFMLGMLILKSVENLSDDALFTRWSRDPYYQYFTGERYFQHQVPHERSGLSHWRSRLGADLPRSANRAQDSPALDSLYGRAQGARPSRAGRTEATIGH